MRTGSRDDVTVEIAYAVLPSALAVALAGALLLAARLLLGLDSTAWNRLGAAFFAVVAFGAAVRTLLILLRSAPWTGYARRAEGSDR